MNVNEERLSRAAAAGKRATAGPVARDQKVSLWTRLAGLAGYVLIGYAAVRAEGWLSWALWVYLAYTSLWALLFERFFGKLRRRKMLLAREQVHRVRQLDASDPAGLGVGYLFDADPDLDRLAVEAGIRFALARVNAVLDEVETAIPEPTLWGYTISDDGKATKK